MPFTFSHPAVIIPFRYIGKKYFSITGLIIGSIIPDFEYFIRVQNRSRFSHTWDGVFWFDLPLALFTCFLFHTLIKGPLIGNLPFILHSRFSRFCQFNWNKYFQKNWKVVIYSILIGVFTHLISDKITHKSSNLVNSVPGLIENQELIDNPKSVYRLIQITYSIIGLLLCLFTIWQLPVDKRIDYSKPDIRYWLILFCSFAIMLVMIILKQGLIRFDMIVGPISSLIVAFIFTSLIVLPGKRLIVMRRYAPKQFK
ncbi:MAG: DUF4184 family protein [Chitinophagaceae bacterium]